MRLQMHITTTLVAMVTISAAGGNIVVPRQSPNDSDYQVGYTPLKTNWTANVGTSPWPEYPRPRLQRSEWKNLNGVWRYRDAKNSSQDSPPFGERLEKPVLVPFCLESALSGGPTQLTKGEMAYAEQASPERGRFGAGTRQTLMSLPHGKRTVGCCSTLEPSTTWLPSM